jgi:C-terminal processing protease CtpA/Prc
MESLKKTMLVLVLALFCAPVIAQDDAVTTQTEAQLRQQEAAVLADKMREAESRLRERAETMAQTETMAQRSRKFEIEVRLKDAEHRLAEAARQVGDLSMARLPGVERLAGFIRANRGPVLGIAIASEDSCGPVEGVQVVGVSPGAAAEEAGLRAGDVITSINDESLSADTCQEANKMLLDFMKGVEEGDTLNVAYLRDGKSDTTEISPRPLENNVFAFKFDDGNFTAPNIHVAPNSRAFGNFVWSSSEHGFGAMELAQLSERLGSYFGTDEGLLVVRAPDDEDLKLEDGDVILRIDGREPTSIAHAMRILHSYEGGEELKIEIMRDKRKRTVNVEMPDNRQSLNSIEIAPDVQIMPRVNVVVVEEEST